MVRKRRLMQAAVASCFLAIGATVVGYLSGYFDQFATPKLQDIALYRSTRGEWPRRWEDIAWLEGKVSTKVFAESAPFTEIKIVRISDVQCEVFLTGPTFLFLIPRTQRKVITFDEEERRRIERSENYYRRLHQEAKG